MMVFSVSVHYGGRLQGQSHLSVETEENIKSLVKKVDMVGVFIDSKKNLLSALPDIPDSCRENYKH